jgi:hypothetical protein
MRAKITDDLMDFGESLTGRMPPVRADEPPGLRQEILDELTDHLACSLQREVLRGGDPVTARARTLEQFGDPAAVARQLWLDAMRGRIMAQRVLIGTCALVAAASVLSVGILWQELIQARRTAADQAAAQVAEARAREQLLLEQLRGMSESIKNSRSTDRNLVRITLAEGSADGPSVGGATIQLTCVSESPHKQFERKSGEPGTALFGPLEPGDYEFCIIRSWANGSMKTEGTLDVKPGIEINKQVVCPKVPPQRAGIRLRWQWPADLEKESLILNASFVFDNVESAPGLRWRIDQKFDDDAPSRFGIPISRSVLCGPSKQIASFKGDRGLLLWTTRSSDVGSSIEKNVKLDRSVFAFGKENEMVEFSESGAPVELEAGTYELLALYVLRPGPAQDAASRLRCFNLMVACRAPGSIGTLHVDSKPPSKEFLETRDEKDQMKVRFSTPTIDLPQDYWVRNKLLAIPGKTNDWTIPLPDELIEAVRAALKAEKAETDKSLPKVEGTNGNGFLPLRNPAGLSAPEQDRHLVPINNIPLRVS